MIKKILLGLGCVVLAAGVIWLGLKLRSRRASQQKATTSCQKVDKDYTSSRQVNQVFYIQGCFVPNRLTIKIGESVIFTDKGDTPMWIISDSKNGQLIVPSFNSGQAWGNGESYGHSFEKAGTYGYYNKSKPSDKGMIIVK